MASVIQEIDLVLNTQSLVRLQGDLDKASKQIGTGLAAGATPAAINFSKQLITTLQDRLRTESSVLAKQLAEGSLSPGQYTAAAERLGKSITTDLRKGILSGGKLDLFGGEGGLALRNQLQGITTGAKQATAAVAETAVATEKLDQASIHAHPGFGRMRSALFTLASQATGTSSAIGSLASGLLLFAGGSTIALGVAAGIGVIALAWDKLTESTRKAKQETDKWIEKAREAIRMRLPEGLRIQQDIADAHKHIAELTAEFAVLEARQRFAGAPAGALTPRMGEIIADLKVARQQAAGLEQDISKVESVSRGRTKEGIPIIVTSRQPAEEIPNVTKQFEERERLREEAARKEKARIEELNRILEKEGQRQLQIAEDQRSISQEAQHALADLTSTTIDNLELQITEFEARVLAAFGRITPEAQKVIDAWKEQIATAKILEPINQSLQDFDDQIRHQDFSLIKIEHNWEKIGDTIRTVAQGILDMARGLGLVDDKTQKILQGMVSIAANLPRAAAGSPAAIIGVIGGVASVVGGVFGHPNKDGERFAQNEAWYTDAVSGDPNALEQLRIHSVVAGPGQAGWGSGPAARDAARKYAAAKKILDDKATAAAPGIAAQTEQDRLDAIRASEEGQVAARTESERRAHIGELLGGGGPADLAAKLQQLEQEFERLVKASPLGEDSPLARDAKQRADDAAQELERAIDAAKSEAERLAGKDITPGFTVQRTLTESSAGRIVGELTTQTIWLEKIHGALVGSPTERGSGAAGVPAVYVYIGGEEFTGVVSAGLNNRLQDNAARNGNGAMS